MVETAFLSCVLCDRQAGYIGVGNDEYDAYDDAMSKAVSLDGWVFVRSRFPEDPVQDMCLDCASITMDVISSSLEKREKILEEKRKNPLTGV